MQRRNWKAEIISLDTETTSLDPWHGGRPFLVTTARHIPGVNPEIVWWEWGVDPLTRRPIVPKKDILEIKKIVRNRTVVMQNSKFDVRMLETLPGFGKWDWSNTHDLYMTSHQINSGEQKDLSYLALKYLRVDLDPYEKEMEKATRACISIIRREHSDWRLAEKGDPEMPSSKGSLWKSDLWTARALLKEGEDIPEEWAELVVNYANCDSESTLLIFLRQMKIIKEKKLDKIYEHRRLLMPVVYNTETHGVTYNKNRNREQIETYEKESVVAGKRCIGIANSMGYELTLPKSGNNNSLLTFVYGEDCLNLTPVRFTDKGSPSLDGDAVETYTTTLDPHSKARSFLLNLGKKRKRDTACIYLEGYERFGIPLEVFNRNGVGRSKYRDWAVLHPSLNPADTHTLRFSSKNPNGQNVSKKPGFNLRYVFGPAPGREWWSIDYNNLEYRITAYESGEQDMIDLFERPDESPFFGSQHLLNASIIYPDMWAKCRDGNEFKDRYPAWYVCTKNFGFAVNYGAHPKYGTADAAARRSGSHAKTLDKFRKNTALSKQWVRFAKEHGYVKTLPDKTVDPDQGYKIYCPLNKYGRIPETKPFNYHIQGTAGWVIGSAMLKVNDYLHLLPRALVKAGYNMVLQIHDELLFDFPYKKDQGNLLVIKEIQRLMESCGDDINIPLTCDATYHPNNWSEGE